MPVRIQRKRTKGWRMPAGAICVTRPGPYGNRWKIGDEVFSRKTGKMFTIETAAQAVAIFRQDLIEHLLDPQTRPAIRAKLAELRDHDLACWCVLSQPCHANVWLDFANRDVTAKPILIWPPKFPRSTIIVDLGREDREFRVVNPYNRDSLRGCPVDHQVLDPFSMADSILRARFWRIADGLDDCRQTLAIYEALR